MPNENIMRIPTKACINGFTKEDTERLKNALVKQILNDKTVVDVTDDGKIIMANDDGLFLSVDDSVIGLTKDSDDNVIPITVPYLPEDENENPLVPPSGTIITSDNIAVDPRIVHTTGNETISGSKSFNNGINAYSLGWHDTHKSGTTVGKYCIFARIPAVSGLSGKFIELDFMQSSNGGTICGRMMFKTSLSLPDAFWVYRKVKGANANMSSDAIHLVTDDTNIYLVSKRESVYGAIKCRVNMVMSYGNVQTLESGIIFIPNESMVAIDDLSNYTEYTIDEP